MCDVGGVEEMKLKMKVRNEMKMRMLKGKKMFSFDVIEDVEMNDSNGGWIKVKVSENVDDSYECMVSRVIVLSFDFGESLCSCLIVEKDSNGKWMEKFSNVEDVFSSEVNKKIIEMDFEISIGDVK